MPFGNSGVALFSFLWYNVGIDDLLASEENHEIFPI
jgi:hypothetical protein